jgi:hypothetical protein
MQDIVIVPPNLARMGVKRKVLDPDPDLIRVYETPYPVLTNYGKLCADADIEPFAGGTYLKQGPEQMGYINSGYREGEGDSAHLYALALDIIAGELKKQIQLANIALVHFCRVGLYPDHKIIHVDLMPQVWIDWLKRTKRKTAARYWVCLKIDGKKNYTYFNTWEETVRFGKERRG